MSSTTCNCVLPRATAMRLATLLGAVLLLVAGLRTGKMCTFGPLAALLGAFALSMKLRQRRADDVAAGDPAAEPAAAN